MITIDTAAPAAMPAPDLIAANDSGISSTDNITNVQTPTFTLSATGPYFRLSRNGVVVSGQYEPVGVSTTSYTSPLLADATYGFTVAGVDVAGNASTASPTL